MRKIILVSLLVLIPVLSRAERPRARFEAVPSSDQLKLAFPGVKGAIPYEKFGRFDGEGTAQYKYIATNRKGLMASAGEGIYPNTDVFKDPAYQKLLQADELKGNHWFFVDSNYAAKNFYKWATTSEEPGVKQFYSAVMLERAGLVEQAIKAYYAIGVHFPKSVSYTYYDTPWYVAPAALDRADQLIRRFPELKLKLMDSRIAIGGKYNTDLKDDVFTIRPGRLVTLKKPEALKPINLSKVPVEKTIGGKKIQLKKYQNKHWQLLVDEKPFPVKAITYSATPVGLSPDRGTWNVSRDWQLLDTNKNGKHDGFDEAFLDKNGNNKEDVDEPAVGDGKILSDMGVNTLRAYHHVYDKELFRRLHKDYGFYVLCGDLLGGYAVGSGATWAEGTNYNSPSQQDMMLAGVRQMVEDFKDEPYILMWVLGNENVYGVASNAGTDPVPFFKLVNRAAQLIHELDPSRPVMVANGDLLYLDIIKEYCPDVDVMGANVYRGEQGFGRHFFMDVQEALDRPVLITEYGVSAFGEGYTKEQAEAYQSLYLANNWDDLEANMAGRGVGNALGGVLFEYVDEWWKANSDLPEKVQKARAEWYAPKSALYKSLQPGVQDSVPQFGFPFLDGWSYEEWYGLASQGDGKRSPFLRVLRPAYETMKKMWTASHGGSK